MRTDAFWDYEAGGIRLADWIGDVVDGRLPASRSCAECAVD